MAKPNPSLTKLEIVKTISKQCGLKKTVAAQLVDDLLEEIVKCLENNIKVKLSKFGNFSIKYKKARYGRNPKTKKAAIISERRVVSFKAHKTLMQKINNHFI